MKKDTIERHLTPDSRRQVFRTLGFHINGQKANSDGYVSGLLGPTELGEGERGDFSVNLETGGVKDFGSGYTGDLFNVVQDVRGIGFREALTWIAEEIGLASSPQPAPHPEPPEDAPAPASEGVPREDVGGWCTALLDGDKGAHRRAREYLTKCRGITSDLLRARRVGLRFDRGVWWIVFPLRVEGERVTLRKERGFDPAAMDWKRDDDGKPFIRTKPSGVGSTLVVMADDDTGGPLLLCAGETDGFSARSNSFNVAFGSAGEGTFKAAWAQQFAELEIAGRGIVVCYDGDDAGRRGAQKAARLLAAEGVPVRLATLPDGADVNDVLTGGGGREALAELTSEATPYEPPADAEDGRSSHSRSTVNGHHENGAHSAERPIHDHGPYRGREIVNDSQATPLFGFQKPAPLQWKVAGLIPEGHISILAADGGVGKSFLSVYLALRVCTGADFFGLATRRGRVLYVDYELDAEEQQRRVWRVAKGMDLSVDDARLMERFFYYRPSAALGTPKAHEEVMVLVERHKIDLVVLDSLSVGSAGSDVTASEDVVPVMQSLREWGTVFAIDHVSGNAARGNQSRATPFGSVFKRNMARSTFTLAKADGGGYLLTPDKSNFTARHDLVCYAVEFEGTDGPVRFGKVDTTDSRMAGGLSDMSTHDVTLAAIRELADDDRPVTPDRTVTWRDEHNVDPIKTGTARNHLTVLKERGKIELKDGGALLASEGFHAPVTPPESVHDGGKKPAPHRESENGLHAARTAKNGVAPGHSRYHAPYKDREAMNEAASSDTSGQDERTFLLNQRVRTPAFDGTICDAEPAEGGRWPVRPDDDVHGEGARYFDADEIERGGGGQ